MEMGKIFLWETDRDELIAAIDKEMVEYASKKREDEIVSSFFFLSFLDF